VPINSDHRATLERIFVHPASANIEWRQVRSLLEALGAVAEEHNGKLKITGGKTKLLQPSWGKGYRRADDRRPPAHAQTRRHRAHRPLIEYWSPPLQASGARRSLEGVSAAHGEV
jgi:hypothetical protein